MTRLNWRFTFTREELVVMDLQKLISYLYQVPYSLDINPIITSIEMDSREVKKGSLFVCIKGYTVNGHNFAQMAEEKGAAAILAEEHVDVSIPVIIVKDTLRALAILSDAFYGQPTHKLHLIGVTGTNGKTTTTHIIESILRVHHQKTGLIGTINTKIGDEIFETKNTTPESLTLQKYFKHMVDNKVDTAIMEVSSHALDLGRVHGCDFNIAVFTNLTQDHLDYHKTMEEYLHAKSLLFSQLGNRFDSKHPKFAVINHDDKAASVFKKSTAATIVTYGIDNESDIMAKDITMTSQYTTFQLVTPIGAVHVKISLIGKFSIYNVLAGAAACVASQVPLEVIKSAIENLHGVPGRFEVVNAGQDYALIVDYAHTPDSLENVLVTIKQLTEGKIIVVVGCGGDRDKSKRPIMASIAAQYADFPIFTSDNPRSEDPVQILKDMEQGVKGQQYEVIVDRKEAIAKAISIASDGDCILIAGKGHETYQLIGDAVYDFDDRKIARDLIKER